MANAPPGRAIMKNFSAVVLSLGVLCGLCKFGVAADPASKTAKQAAAEFGLSDADLTIVPPELYDCIRHYATTGAKYMTAVSIDGDIAEFKNKLLGMRRASTKRFAASYTYFTHPRFVLLRNASGMYHSVKFATLSTIVETTTKQDVSVSDQVFSYYVKQTQSPGDYDRCFLRRGDDGKIYMHEEICTFDEEGAEPRLYDERFLLEQLDGTWEGYLKGDVLVLRLGQSESERRDKAQTKYGKSKKPDNEEDKPDVGIEALKAAAGIRPEEKPKVETSSKDLGFGPALLYIKRDAMLWIDSSRLVHFARVSAQK